MKQVKRRMTDALNFPSTNLISENKIGGELIDVQDPLLNVDVYLSPQNAARYLDVSVKFIYELIQSGQIKCQPVGAKLKRIRKGALDAWLNSQALKFGRCR